jgi:replicative DNA helicase
MSDTPDPGRTPDVEAAERAVLGTIITSRTAAEAVTAILDQDDCFASGIHQAVYAAVRHLTEAGEPCDVPSVLKRLVVAEQGVWRSGQAGVILASLMESATPSYAVHAQTVLRAARQRRTLAALTSAFQVASGPGFDADDGGDMILKLIGDATAGPAKTELRSQAEILSDVVDGLERGIEPGLRTGYSDLDDVLGGLRPGTLIVVGARPGMGKTIIGGGIAEHVSTRLGLPVLFASMEMTAEELMLRRMASTATVPLDSLVRHNLSDDHWDRLNRAHDNLAGSALIVDDQDHVSLAHIRARLRGMERAGNRARMLVIDYLGLFREPKAENRQNAVAALARGCKHLAREFAIPVVLLAQVKRAAEGRADKIPGLSDLRESGEIEQAADVVLLLHREDYYERESPRAGELDVIVAKNRQGPLSTVTLLFQGHYGRIVGLAPEDCDTGREWTPTSMVGGAA